MHGYWASLSGIAKNLGDDAALAVARAGAMAQDGLRAFATAPGRGTWRGEGGGILINQGQHNLDALCFVAGPPRTVHAVTRSAVHPTETEDTAAALLQWAGGGCVRVLDLAARQLRRARVLLLGTFRDVEVGPEHPLSTILSSAR